MKEKSNLEKPEFLVVRASAGSGKTFSLVRQYLRCCLRHEQADYYRHILAITFTNKAADEMKDRVLQGMREMASMKGDHIEEIAKNLNLSQQALAERASRIEAHMMTHYSMISIMTIDKFVNRLVRNFARELALDGDFRLQLDESVLIQEAVERLLNQVGGENKALTAIMERFVVQRIEDEEGWRPKDELIKFGKLLFKESFRDLISRLQEVSISEFEVVHNDWRADFAKAEAAARNEASQALDLIRLNGLEDVFSRRSIPKLFEEWSMGKWKSPSTTIRGNFSTGEGMVPNTKAQFLDQVVAIQPQLTAHYEAVLNFLEGELGRIIWLKKNLAANMVQLAVLQQLDISLSEVRMEENSYTFADLNRTIELLVASSPAPFIYERIGERYKHFLIDEFQDTSVVQWQNFLPLVENSLANGHFNLVVGDGKQAIYRWRNGDVRQLQELPNLIGRQLTEAMKERQAALTRYHAAETLKNNWRSREQVVRFNNDLFLALRETLSDEHRSIYEVPDQKVKGKPGGWVTAEAYYQRSAITELRHPRVLDLVQQNLDQGYRAQDIAILVRSRKEGAGIARYLLEHHIATITEESLYLGRHVAPLSVIHLLQALHTPDDQRGAVKFLQAMSAHQPQFADLSKMLGRYTSIAKEKGEKTRVRIHELLREELGIMNAEVLTELPLYDLIDQLVDQLGVARSFPAYAEKLLSMALEHQVDEAEGLAGFLRYWETEGHKKSITVPENVDGVRVMTVHKSKGLEFPVVISLISMPSNQGANELHPIDLEGSGLEDRLPVAVLPLSKMKDTWAHHEYERERQRNYLDELNIVYVAFTRAVNHLHILLENSEGRGAERSLNDHLEDAFSHFFPTSIRDQRSQLGEAAENDEEAVIVTGEKAIDRLERTESSSRLKVGLNDTSLRSEGAALSALSRGNEVHALLSMVEKSQDLQKLDRLGTPWQRMTSSEWNTLLEDVKEVVVHPDFEQWFNGAPRVYTERAFIDQDGKELRIDRLMCYPDHWVVVDYKTGRDQNERELEKHRKQVSSYIQLLEELTELPVEGYLCYTDELRKEVVA